MIQAEYCVRYVEVFLQNFAPGWKDGFQIAADGLNP